MLFIRQSCIIGLNLNDLDEFLFLPRPLTFANDSPGLAEDVHTITTAGISHTTNKKPDT